MFLCLAGVELDLDKETQFFFKQTTATMNLVSMAKFFYIIFKGFFVSLLVASKVKKGLLEQILNYFAIVETNGRGIVHLYCFVWLKGASYLATLRSQVQDNHEFCQKLLSFFKHVIKCFVCSDCYSEILHHICFDANNSMSKSQFAILLKYDSKFVACKVQIYFLSYNPTCYKYNIRKSKVCRFDFPQPIVLELQIDFNRTIQLRQDNVWVNP